LAQQVHHRPVRDIRIQHVEKKVMVDAGVVEFDVRPLPPLPALSGPWCVAHPTAGLSPDLPDFPKETMTSMQSFDQLTHETSESNCVMLLCIGG
jgi:hypothetical protein